MFHRIAAVAWRQHGAFTTAQAIEAGGNRNWLTRAMADGTIERCRPGVYVLAAAPKTWRQVLMVEVLTIGSGGLATGDSALALWCDELGPPRAPVVLAPESSGHRSSRRRRVIRSCDLELANPGVVDGIPVAGVARALLDASIDTTPDAVVRRVNACQRQLPMSFGALVDVLHSHARRGRPGTATFRKALAAMTDEVPDSEFERLVLRDLARAGAPAPELHHLLRPKGHDPIEMDAAWPDRKLDVELDGRDHLTRMKTGRRDRQRDRILVAQGWIVPRFTWSDYLEDPVAMVDEIIALVSLRGRTISGS